MTDAVVMGFPAWRTWPRGDLRILATARALPFAFVTFIPAHLYFQISISLGNGREGLGLSVAHGILMTHGGALPTDDRARGDPGRATGARPATVLAPGPKA